MENRCKKILLWPHGFKNQNMHDSICVCVYCITLVKCVCVCVCVCGSTGTGVRAGVLLRLAAMPGHTVAPWQPCPPLTTSNLLRLFLHFALSLLTLLTYLQSLFLSSILTCLVLVLFSSPPPAPKWAKSHNTLHVLLHLHFLPVSEPNVLRLLCGLFHAHEDHCYCHYCCSIMYR